jgi:ribosomal protein S18 acetylase RimI-like enzyme
MESREKLNICEVDRRHKAEALDVLCAAFHDYPVMRYVIGQADPDYDAKLRELIGLFVEARLTRNVPLIGVYEADQLLGIAVVSPPKEIPVPRELAECHARVERRLGPEAMARFDRYGEACEATDPGHLAHYLGMIAVRPGAQRRGLGHRLIDAVKELARSDPDSAGVTLNTESSGNLLFYERMGFRRGAEADFGPLHTWSFFWSSE